jgi:steroid delta-isomerase-like uncharacterized protein
MGSLGLAGRMPVTSEKEVVMSEQNKSLVRNFTAAFDRQDWDGLSSLVTPDFRMRVAGNPEMDLAGIVGFATAFYEAIPDMTHNVEDAFCEGDTVILKMTITGTHTAALQNVPPSGNSVSIDGVGVAQIRDGKVARVLAVADMLSLMQQVGAIPSVQQATVAA